MAGTENPSERKRAIRARLRERRRAIDPARASAAARSAGRHLDLRGIATLLGYLATDGEMPVDGLLGAALEAGATILLPRMRGDGGIDLVVLPSTTAASDLSELAAGRTPPGFTRGRGGIAEPAGPARDPAAASRPAMALVPAVALDLSGNRLGRGGGAYDRVLGRLRELGWRTIGVCHAAHLEEDLPTEPHDVKVDAVLTEDALREVAVEGSHPRGPKH
ncbi:MAG: 5-formyltetrahydrofolate cyclo-ligase [Alphaproteobacteria bacterium]